MPSLAAPEFIGQEWGGQRGIDNFLKGFALMASVAARRNQSELQIAKLENQIRSQEVTHQIAMQREEDQASHWKDMAEIGDARLRQQSEYIAFKQGRTKDQLDAASTMTQKINSIDAPKHTQEWRDAVNDAMLDHPDAAGTPQYKQFQDVLKREKNPTFRSQQITLDNRIQGLGIPKNYLYGALENPDTLTTTDKSTPDTIFLYGGKRQVTKPDKTVEEQSVYLPVKKDTWTRLKKTYDEMYRSSETGLTLANTIPDDKHSSEWQRAKTALKTRDPLQVKKLYQSKGFDPSELDSDTPP